MSNNPFQNLAQLSSMNEFNEKNISTFNIDLIEEILLITFRKDLSDNFVSRPKYLYLIEDVAEDNILSPDNIDNLIFERIFTLLSKDNIIKFDKGYEVEFNSVIEDNPLSYLYGCYMRIIRKMNMKKHEISDNISILKEAILNQSSLYIINNHEIAPEVTGSNFYIFLSTHINESDCLSFTTELFNRTCSKLNEDGIIENHIFYFNHFFQYFLKQTFLNKLPPLSNVLGIWRDPLQTLYCPERNGFAMMMSLMSNIPVAAEMILDFSNQGLMKGIDFERCLLGRFLCFTHLPSGLMQSPEVFNKMPMTIQEKNVEEKNIWQLTKTLLNDSCYIFMKIFQCAKLRPQIKDKLLRWFGKCLHLNSGRNKLLHTTNNIPNQDNNLANDGFIMNLINVLFHISSPLLTPPLDKVFTIQVEYTDDANNNRLLLPGLFDETRLIPMREDLKSSVKFLDKYTVLTQLFFLMHKSFQLGFHVVHGKFIELNQQLHRMQEVYDDLINGEGSNTPEGERVKKMMSNQMSLYMSLNSVMRLPDFMTKSFAMVVSSCKLLVEIARTDNDVKNACIPEFVMDNIVDFLGYLRHFDDGFFETNGFGLDSILEMSVLFMSSTKRVKNPHLRAKIATLIECLIPQRDDSTTSGSKMTFYMRQQLFEDNASWTHEIIIEALVEAFTTMELATSGENLRFEEKFEYRRPIYACMRFFYGIPKFDAQFKILEQIALENINEVEAPLCLKFLNLLINDATYLLDEALNYLGQLKTKEMERFTQGGRYSNQTDEANFQHMVMLAKYHNTLAADTMEQISRMANLCPNIIIHQILVDRIACTLNYFLDHLVGPKRFNLTVKDKEAYAFKPKQLVQIIVQIYVSLGEKTEFCAAIVNDGRSYSDKLLETAVSLIERFSIDMDLFSQFVNLKNRLKIYSANQNEEDVNFDDAPEEYLDPIMGTLMRDPVILPSSGQTVEKKTIFRHLLSDPTDPFNRQPLAMADVRPNEALKQEIIEWIQKQKK